MKKNNYLIVSMILIVSYLVIFGFAKKSLAGWTDISGSLSEIRGSISTIIQISDGSIYAGGRYNPGYDDPESRVYKYYSNSWSNISGSVYFGENVNSLLEAQDGTIYAGTLARDIRKYLSGAWTEASVPLSWYFTDCYSLFQASDNTIYAGGLGFVTEEMSGPQIYKYASNSWSEIFSSTSLENQPVYSIVQSSDGSIIAGGMIGVYKYSSNSGWSNISGPLDDQGGEITYSLIKSLDGYIYAGGRYIQQSEFSTDLVAKVWRLSGDSWTDVTGSLSGEYVKTLYQTTDGSIYVGVEDNNVAKVWRYSGNSWTDITGTLIGNSINYITEISDGSIYAGGSANDYTKVWKYTLTPQEQRQIDEQNLQQGNRFTLHSALNKHSISGQALILNFKKLPNKLTKNNQYWMRWQKFNKYAPKWTNKKKNSLKRHWKLTTNLKNYKAKNKKQKFQIKITFKYTKKLFNNLKKKHPSLKKSDLYLKYRTKKSSWKEITSLWKKAQVIKKSSKNGIIIKYFTKFPKKTYYFGIGVK